MRYEIGVWVSGGAGRIPIVPPEAEPISFYLRSHHSDLNLDFPYLRKEDMA